MGARLLQGAGHSLSAPANIHEAFHRQLGLGFIGEPEHPCLLAPVLALVGECQCPLDEGMSLLQAAG